MQSTFFIALLVINTVHAQSSSVETTIESSLDLQTLILSIPCVEVGADYYSLDLRLITKEPTIDFEVAGFDTLDIGACVAASFTTTLQVQQVSVGAVWYSLGFELLQDPLLFRLTEIQDITSTVNSDPAFEFYAQNIAAQFIQLRCIACHVAKGIADMQNAEIIYLPNPDLDGDILQFNFNSLKSFLAAAPGNETLYLDKASGAVTHVGGTMINSAERLIFQQLFDLL